MIIKHNSPLAAIRINAERDVTLFDGFYWAPKDATFDSDARSVSLITGRVAKIQALNMLGNTMGDFIWRDQDNTDHTFTPSEFLEFAVAMDEWVEAKYIEAWQKKAAL